jgi:hypothetical protein
MHSRLFVRIASHVRPGQIRAGTPAAPAVADADLAEWNRNRRAVVAELRSLRADAMRDRG